MNCKSFSRSRPEEWLLYQFYLCSGGSRTGSDGRGYDDLDFVDGLFNVREKIDWKPKDREEREIPIPDFLVAALKRGCWRLKAR